MSSAGSGPSQDEHELRVAAGIPGSSPGYQFIFSSIADRIESRRWLPDEQIPGERELSRLYNVSRGTVRQALDRAVQQGLLVRVPGRGTFVSRPRIHQDLAELQTFRSTIAQYSLRPTQRVLRMLWEPVPDRIAKQLALPRDSPVLSVELLGLADERPVSYYHSYVRQPAAEGVEEELQKPVDHTASTYEVAAEYLAAEELVADQTFEAVALAGDHARLLKVTPGTAAFRVSSIFRTLDRAPVEFRLAVYPGEIYTFHIDRRFRFER